MRYFLDTEFIESGPSKPIQLISIGMVSEDGHTLYAINSQFNSDDASRWVKDNVLAQLEPGVIRMSLSGIALKILQFIGKDPNPEFWGYYSDYDWVVFCQIFGTMMELPNGFPMYCRDIKQLCDDRGNPELPKQGKGEHNALADALWNKVAFDFLSGTK